jgi:RNA polymerase sigma-70 factor, ECF subfamily
MENGQQDSRHADFLRLFSAHSQRIYEFILTLVMRQVDAEEIFQTTSLILWEKFDTYDPDGNFRAWACRIAYLQVMNLRRATRRYLALSDEALAVLSDKALAHSEDLGHRHAALEACLERLAPQDREIIEQRYYHRRSPKELAMAKACSVHVVYRKLSRVHTALLECVQRRLSLEELR